MTLSLSLASKLYVVQVTDRLVTWTVSGEVFDEISNKNVIYRGRDGLVSIAYSGPAYVDGMPTDQWIATMLTGEKLDLGFPWSVLQGATANWFSIGQIVNILAAQLNQRINSLTPKRIEILFSGWLWPRRRQRESFERARPIAWKLTVSQAGAKCVTQGRRWHQQYLTARFLGLDLYWPHYKVNGIPGRNLADTSLASVAAGLGGSFYSPLAATEQLVKVMRQLSDKYSVIGRNCLAIYLPHPSLRKIQSLFFADYETASIRIGDKVVAPADFMPWVIGGDMIVAPSLFAGGFMRIQVSGFEFAPLGRDFEKTREFKTGEFVGGILRQPRPPAP